MDAAARKRASFTLRIAGNAVFAVALVFILVNSQTTPPNSFVDPIILIVAAVAGMILTLCSIIVRHIPESEAEIRERVRKEQEERAAGKLQDDE
jgi:uncharacterized integral membrane protein